MDFKMALVKKLEQLSMDRNSVHGEVEATYCIFSDGKGNNYLQIDTYGSPHRQIPNKKSQSIQLDADALKQLRQILNEI
jgi:hypothetical protein